MLNVLNRQARSAILTRFMAEAHQSSWGWWQHHPRPVAQWQEAAEHAWGRQMAGTGGAATSLTVSAPGQGVLQRTILVRP